MATKQELLAQAEEAYHKLMLGQTVVEVRDSNGETIRFNAANANKLATYINDLKRQLGQITSGPMQVVF